MSQEFDITVTISSYNRDDKILQTLKRLFESELDDFRRIELIVVDDGSPRPVADLLPQIREIPEKIELRLIRQENSGIGATRNRGFREARARAVLFLDDDILLERDTLRRIFRAQRDGHGAVIFGSYPFISHESEALERFARRLFGYDELTEEARYEPVNAITSGLLCVDKAQLAGLDDFYRDDLTVPAAEEYEVVYRFHRLGVPIVHAKHIYAVHNHHLELGWLVEQQYKYGLGTAEAFLKYDEIAALDGFSGLKTRLDAIGRGGLKNALKSLMASDLGRRNLLRLARAAQRLSPRGDHAFLFGMLTSSYYWAGYRAGLERFSKSKEQRG